MSNIITTKGFTWLVITQKAKEVFVSGCFEVYRLHEDGSESLIEEYEDLVEAQEQEAVLAIEVGCVPTNEEWAETHHELVLMINEDIEIEGTMAHINNGHGHRWMLAIRLTNEFQEKYKDDVWGETADWFDTLEEFYQANRIVKGNENDKFSRKCSFTGNGMDEGWYFESDGTYASTQELADAHAVTLGYKNFDDLYESEGGDESSQSCYTSWIGDEEYIVSNGILEEIN
jgi:hypothetical protein